MEANFLPKLVEQLTEPTSIALAQIIQRTAIATTYVHQGSGGTPILLLHGFDSSVLEFCRLLPSVAAENEAWAVDMLGFGFTDRIAGIPFNPNAIKTHLYYFWKNLVRQRLILWGILTEYWELLMLISLNVRWRTVN